MTAQEEGPQTTGVVAGQGPYEKLPTHRSSNDDTGELFREAQSIVAGMLRTVDRLAAAIARVAGGA